jgi:hypothetical protein
MNLERFKKLEDEVKQDLYDYIGKTRTIFGFKPQYKTKVIQIRTDGFEGIVRKARTRTATNFPTDIRKYNTDYSQPLSEESEQGYKLLAQFAWR